MDNKRFDSLVKSLASGTNRRSVLKGLLGLGTAASMGGTLPQTGVEAARRPTPTPKPITCPGSQHWDGSKCACTTGETCGSACCHIGTECCDGGCCFGHCYGEELCCSYDDWCDAANECCPDGATCCGELGCVVIEEGDCGCGNECPDGFECCGGQCCASGYCAGETCCALGACGGVCLTNEGDACCGTYPYNPDELYCCDGAFLVLECCGTGGCEPGFECCNDSCCPEGHCAFEGCCAGIECGGRCLNDDNRGCCGDEQYDLIGNVCCDDEVYPGFCCTNDDCGTCSSCQQDRTCSPPRC